MNQIITRDSYGCILRPADLAKTLVTLASTSKKIPAASDNTDWVKVGGRNRRLGTALHHDIYDYSDSSVLVCCRETEGGRYGVKTLSKTYFVVRKCGKGVTVSEANKAIAAKAAKTATMLGEALAVVAGKQKLKTPSMATRIGYKMVRRDDTGHLISVWDGSPWTIGVTRTEKSTPNHTGGFYYYATPDEAIQAAIGNDIFGHARDHEKLVLVEVEAQGREHTIHSDYGVKRCVTRIKPLREFFQMI